MKAKYQIIKEAVSWMITKKAVLHIQNEFKSYPDVLSVDQLCEALGGISRRTVYRLLQENKIDSIKVGREYRVAKINVIDFLINTP